MPEEFLRSGGEMRISNDLCGDRAYESFALIYHESKGFGVEFDNGHPTDYGTYQNFTHQHETFEAAFKEGSDYVRFN